jgi:hypothetical protein
VKATSAPSESRPSATALPPAHNTTSVPMPATRPMSGVKRACARASAVLASRSAPLAAPNSAVARPSIVYARTTPMPASRSCTSVESASRRSCIAWVRAVTVPL